MESYGAAARRWTLREFDRLFIQTVLLLIRSVIALNESENRLSRLRFQQFSGHHLFWVRNPPTRRSKGQKISGTENTRTP